MKVSNRLIVEVRSRVAGRKIPFLATSVMLMLSCLAAQASPNLPASAPDLKPSWGDVPQAPTPRGEPARAQQGAQPAQAGAVQMHAILGQWHGSSYHLEEFSITRLDGSSRWREFWRQRLGREEPVEFDEARHRAVYLALGVRPTGGYAVRVVSAHEEDSQLVLEYVESAPAPDRYVTQALTTPWAMVLLPRSGPRRVVARKAGAPRAD